MNRMNQSNPTDDGFLQPDGYLHPNPVQPGVCRHDPETNTYRSTHRLIRPRGAKFQLGQLVATPPAVRALDGDTVATAMLRHIRGDWGDVCQADKEANDRALVDGTRLLSAYTSPAGVKFWIITEADRSATTVLLPEDY